MWAGASITKVTSRPCSGVIWPALARSPFHARRNLLADQYSAGRFTFSGQATGLVLADLLAGMPSNFQDGPDNSQRVSQWFVGGYASDAWKVTPRLTASYGLRWEPGFP